MLTDADLAQIQAMIDAAPGVGEGFPQPIVAGQQLLIPGIQSPNFSLAGQTGWQLLLSGAATFFNLTLSGGTITGPDYIFGPTGFFLYSGVPAVGNLILALAPQAENDPLGNPVPQGLLSNQLTLANQAAAPAAFAGASVFYSSIQGRPRYKSSAGADNILERADVNITQFTAGNVVSPGANISSPMTYQPGEANQSSEFELEISGLATMAAAALQNLLFELFIDGASTVPATKVSASPSGWTANQVIGYMMRFTISFLGAGIGTSAVCIGSGIANLAGTGGPGNTVGLNTGPGGGGAVTIDSTAGHTFQIRAYWANASAGQSLTTYRTKLTRRD